MAGDTERKRTLQQAARGHSQGPAQASQPGRQHLPEPHPRSKRRHGCVVPLPTSKCPLP